MNYDDIYQQQHKDILDSYEFEKYHDSNSYFFLLIARNACKPLKNTLIITNKKPTKEQISEDELVGCISDALFMNGSWNHIMLCKMGHFLYYANYYNCSEAMARYVIYKHRDAVFKQ